jgi:regulatory protein
MKITAIKQQIKRFDRYSVYVDGVYTFSLSEAQLVSSGIHSGLEIDSETLAGYQEESTTGKLFDRLLNLFSYRMRSEWEVRDYLRRKQVDESQTTQLIERMQKLGYINDEVFARSWVENRRFGKPTSQRKLRAELQAKRIDRGIVDKILNEDASQTDEMDVLRQLVAKKRARYPDDVKFMQYLARQGFGYDDIKRAIKPSDELG